MIIYVIFWQNYYFFQNIQVNRLDFNAWKCWQTCHYIELSEYKLYMGHIHTLVLTREWIAMLGPDHIYHYKGGVISPFSLAIFFTSTNTFRRQITFYGNFRADFKPSESWIPLLKSKDDHL